MEEILNDVQIKINLLNQNNDLNNYQITIKIPMQLGWLENVKFILNGKDNYKMNYINQENDLAVFQTHITIPTCAIYHYCFSCEANGNLIYIKRKNHSNLQTNLIDENWKLSVNFDVPDWAKGKVMYHVFVDRFKRGSKEKMEEMPRRKIHNSWEEDVIIGPDEQGIWNNDFYGGDLKGIKQQLPYLKSLGVDIIYLSPIVKSQSNHRYDTGDYEIVDPYAGTNEDLKNLCESAHNLGMAIILDAVFNHTGNDSKYFNEFASYDTVGAYQSSDSIYNSFYRKKEENGQSKFDYWWGMKNLPVCDGNSSSWIEYITGPNGIIDKWFALGIDGLRLDVADELTDKFIKKIRQAVKRNKEDGFIIGEVWKNPMHMNREYLSSGQCMDTVMNYWFIDALLRYYNYTDIDKLTQTIEEILTEYPKDTINSLMNFTSTHDITRAINLFSKENFQENGEWAWNLKNDNIYWCKDYVLTNEQYEHNKQIYESYVFALTFFPGILSIFYGDEIGIQGMGNLSNRKPYPQTEYDKELLDFFKKIGNIRKNEPFLRNAELEMLDINQDYLMFERYDQYDKMLVVVSKVNEEVDFNIPKEYKNNSKIYTLKKSKLGSLKSYGGIAIKK